MKICILTHTFPRYAQDSTAAFMHSLCEGLAKKHDVTVLAPFDEAYAWKNGETLYRIRTYRYIVPSRFHVMGYSRMLHNGNTLELFAYLLFPFMFLSGCISLYRIVRQEQMDVISAHWVVPNGIMAAVVHLLTGVPFTVTLPGSDVYLAKKNRIFAWLTTWAVSQAGAVIADSPRFLDELHAISPKRTLEAVIPYPVELEKFKKDPEEIVHIKKTIKIDPKEQVLLAVGRMVEKKGFDMLLRSLPQILHRFPNTVSIFVGDGDLRTTWEQLAKDLGVEDHVRFVGSKGRKELVAYYYMADIFVMPSVRDSFGNIDDQPVSLIEAMACGKSVVATDFPGIAGTVDDEVNGLLVPEANSDMLADAICKLFGSTRLRTSMGMHSRQIVEASLTSSHIADRYTQIFQKVMGGSDG